VRPWYRDSSCKNVTHFINNTKNAWKGVFSFDRFSSIVYSVNMMIKEKDMTLEELIEKAIAENTDPFTTDADIRFFETEEWNAKKLLDNVEGIE